MPDVALTRPSVRYDMLQEEYFSSKEVSHSKLKAFVEGKVNLNLPRARALIGNYTDTLLLEPGKVDERYFLTAKGGPSLATRKGKAWYAAECDANLGLEGVRPEEADDLKWLVAEARKDPTIRKILSKGWAQVSLFGEIDDVPARGRLDWVTDKSFLWDVKTQHVTNQEDFEAQCIQFGYYSQAAWYSDLWTHIHNGEPPKGFGHIILSKRNGKVWTSEPTKREIEFGRQWNRTVLKIWKRYKDAA